MFNDLLSRLLEKDPVKRISWEHLRKHPFWTKEINLRKLPRQPAFESYLKKNRGINPDQFVEQQMKDGYFIPNLAHFSAPSKVDPLRVSQTVRRLNDQEGYDKKGGAKEDFELLNKDQELVFSAQDKKQKVEDAGALAENEALEKQDLPTFTKK